MNHIAVKQKRSKLYRAQRGQGLAEYALLLILVAVVVIVAVFGVGLGVQRVYGIVVGALGTHHDAVGDETITIASPVCWVVSAAKAPPNGQTGLYITFSTNVSLSDLTGSTNLAVGGPIGGTPPSAEYQPLLGSVADEGLCPKSVVIQSKKGAIAASPVQIKYLN